MKTSNQIQIYLVKIIFSVLILSMLVACGYSKEDLNSIDYTPLVRDDWPVSTPEEQGLDSSLVAHMYLDAAELETIFLKNEPL